MRKEIVLALAALGLGNLMLAQDLAALNVALPSIERDLNADLSTAQWIVNVYLLVYGMMIVPAGRLADELGRRKVFLIGAAIFAAAALLGALAPGISWLIAARALMGVGGGLMLPALTGMAYAILPPEKAELAGGLTVGAYGIGMSIGPMIGGGLTEFFGWRWMQLVNLPIAALVMFGVWRAIPAGEPQERGTIDYRGIATLSVGLVALLVTLDQASAWGWGDWRILLGFALAALCLLAFLPIERRAGAAALVPDDLMRNRRVALACVLKLLMAPAYSAAVLYLPQVMQKLFGFSPLQAGAGLLPMLVSYTVVAFLVGSLAARISLRLAIIAGLIAMTAGMGLLSTFDDAAGYRGLVAGMAAMGIGLGLFQPSVVTAAVKSDSRNRKSLVGGLTLMFQFVGGAVGLGLTTTIVASTERTAVDRHLAELGATLPTAERAVLERVLSGAESAQQVLQQFPAADAARILQVAGEAFAAGVQSGWRLDAAFLAAGVMLALLFLGRERRTTSN